MVLVTGRLRLGLLFGAWVSEITPHFASFVLSLSPLCPYFVSRVVEKKLWGVYTAASGARGRDLLYINNLRSNFISKNGYRK